VNPVVQMIDMHVVPRYDGAAHMAVERPCSMLVVEHLPMLIDARASATP